ncbi:diguanylate cyclase [Azoarcus sp. DD4]|uniref:diguanylate cyclase n=1 Tax=Azoarcus sp. DD4 TaxID=2027405 RepID=UPI00143D005F|nr:diguanylate cyclase [Azoarcus sp. DD4]
MSLAAALTLKQRLLMVVLIPAAVLAAVITTLLLVRDTQAMDDAAAERGVAIVSFLAPAAEYGVISGNRANLTGLLQAVLGQREVVAVAIYNPDGSLLAVSGKPRMANVAAVLATGAAAALERNSNRISFAAPVMPTPLVIDDIVESDPAKARAALRPIGWVYVEVDTRSLADRKRDLVFGTLAVVVFGLGLTAALALKLARSVVEPLARLVDAVKQMAAGKLDVSVPDSGAGDEMQALESGFNAMARSIADAHKTLQARVDEATSLLAHQALHDPLTGLPNRRAFEQALEEAVAGSRRAGDHGVLCFIDLDRFKIVNDTCGHAAGDELLRRIARLIRQRVRAEDLICRIGGDEFALILLGCPPGDAFRIAEGLREAVAAFRFTWEGRRFSIGASIGLVRIDGGMATASDVLVAADLACYAAKKNGRNRVVEHDAAPVGRRQTDVPLAAQLPDSIPFDRLVLFCQPVFPVGAADTVAWSEVLLRVIDEAGMAGSAAELLGSFEQDQRLVEVDEWVAAEVCATLARRSATGQQQRVSLNLSRSSVLAAERYVGALSAQLRRHALDPDLVVLEFPASMVEQSPDESRNLAREARRIGCRIALERMDGGAVSLLKTLHPDYVKISLKLLVETYGLEAGCNLAQALCGMAAALSIRSVASEVEDELLRDSLRDYGFDFAQGTIIAATVPLDG